MRLFTATLATETNTFSPLPTSLENYRESVFLRPGEHPKDAPRMCTAPLFVAGARSFAGDVLAHAGFENAADGNEAYPRWTVEQLIAKDPDIVFLTAATGMGGTDDAALAARVGSMPGWSRLRAVTSKRVLLVRGDAVLRPGPRIADGVLQLNELGRKAMLTRLGN